jgi:hypothetical protein
VILLFRYFWFACAAMMLVNVAFWRRSLRKLVDDGAMTEHEMNGFIRAAALWLAGPPVVLGVIGLAAGWSDPFCAGILSFDGVARTAASLVVLGCWATLLWWVWAGNGAELLGRVGPALSNPPRYDRRYPPRLVQVAITALVLGSAIPPAIMWRRMDVPRSPDGCVMTELAR